MRMQGTASLLSGLLFTAACQSSAPPSDPAGGEPYAAYHAHDLMFGDNDNPEVVRLVPGTRDVLIVASKSRKLTRARVDGDRLVELRSQSLFADDTSESELTYAAVSRDGRWAVLTRTIVDADVSGAITACRGEAVFVAVADDASFGSVLTIVDVGPMPDSVDISPDGLHVAVGNERDVVWGKCEGVPSVDPPSVSLLALRDGPDSVEEVARIEMISNADREPEGVVFLPDGSAVVVTLQDSHEVAVIPLPAAFTAEMWTDANLVITSLPPSAVGQDAWPDGVTWFRDGEGVVRLAVAGEGNDTIAVLDVDGSVVTVVEVESAAVPPDFPRDGTWGPLFRPDSITTFEWAGRSYIAVSLKASGAVGVWDVTDVAHISVASVVKVGRDEMAGPDSESTVSPEGIAASSEHGFIVTANEGEGSVSLVLPLAP